MPLVGGGGAPNVAGSNPAGTGNSLNYIGNHVHASSGSFPDTQSQATMLKFSTQNSYVVGKFVFYGSTHTDQTAGSITAGNTNNFQILIDNEVVGVVKTDTGQEDMPSEMEVPMLLPPNAKIEVSNISGSCCWLLNTSNVCREGILMPKKKLTKTKVKKQFKSILNGLRTMFEDKIGHTSSIVPISANKLLDKILEMQRAEKRVK